MPTDHPAAAPARTAHRARSVALLLALGGCVDASAFLLGDTRFPPYPAAHEVVVFDTVEDVPYPYTKVARVVVSGSAQSAWDSVFDALKAKAREVGGDAVVLARGGQDAAELDGDMVMRRTLWALVIRRQAPKPTTPQ